MRLFDKSPGVKICGYTRRHQAQQAVGIIDAIGVNFWPGSKRYIAAEDAAPWLSGLAGICRVGLFVNPGYGEIARIAELSVLDAIQLHGDESPEFCEQVSALGLPLIKAIAMKQGKPARQPDEFATPYILLDTYAPGQFGGSGQSFSWQDFHQVKQNHPGKFFILAGGLTPDNVTQAVLEARPDAVDAASGVEIAPGDKDEMLVRLFARRATSAIT